MKIETIKYFVTNAVLFGRFDQLFILRRKLSNFSLKLFDKWDFTFWDAPTPSMKGLDYPMNTYEYQLFTFLIGIANNIIPAEIRRYFLKNE